MMRKHWRIHDVRVHCEFWFLWPLLILILIVSIDWTWYILYIYVYILCLKLPMDVHVCLNRALPAYICTSIWTPKHTYSCPFWAIYLVCIYFFKNLNLCSSNAVNSNSVTHGYLSALCSWVTAVPKLSVCLPGSFLLPTCIVQRGEVSPPRTYHDLRRSSMIYVDRLYSSSPALREGVQNLHSRTDPTRETCATYGYGKSYAPPADKMSYYEL